MRCGLLAGALALALLGLGVPGPALAQSAIAALVNDDPISAFDVAQRERLMQATGQKNMTRAEVVNELVEERIKLQEARRLRISVDDAEVERAYNSIAERVKMTPAQLTAAFGQLGINPKTLRGRLKADMLWRKIVQGKLRGTVRLREADVISALQERNKDGKGKVVEYQLQQVVFVVPQKGGAGVTAQRRQEAEGFRSRFVSCSDTLPKTRGLKDVVVKDLGRKRSDELSKDIRDLLADTNLNKLTKPNVSAGGVELIAVCEKREITDDNAGEKQIRDEMMSGEMQNAAKKLMAELRQKALVEIR